jgi:hypothetical protein
MFSRPYGIFDPLFYLGSAKPNPYGETNRNRNTSMKNKMAQLSLKIPPTIPLSAIQNTSSFLCFGLNVVATINIFLSLKIGYKNK